MSSPSTIQYIHFFALGACFCLFQIHSSVSLIAQLAPEINFKKENSSIIFSPATIPETSSKKETVTLLRNASDSKVLTSAFKLSVRLEMN